MVRLSTLRASYWLMMHGLACEALQGGLRAMKRAQVTGEAVFGLAAR
jgi:hypothetical protein